MKTRELNYIRTVQSEMRGLLNAGLRSESAFESALTKLDAKAQQLYKFLDRFAPKVLTDDDTPMSLHAEVGSDALGTNTVAQASLTASLVERPLYSIALASAVSVAAASGGDQVTFASSFTDVSGADFSYTKVKSVSGNNFQASKEMMVAIDFSFLDLPGTHLSREVNVVANRAWARVDDSNVATAEIDLVARAEHTAVIADTSVLTIEDFFSSSAISADLFIA